MINVSIRAVEIDCIAKKEKSIFEYRVNNDYTIMKNEVLEMAISKTFNNKDNIYTFIFDGEEPLLAGIEFFQKVINIQKQYSKSSKIINIIKTQGTLIDEVWARFLKENNILVELLLDVIDIKEAINLVSNNETKKSSKIINVKNTLDRNSVKYSVITQIKDMTVFSIDKLYDFYKKEKINFIDLKPFVEWNENKIDKRESLTPEDYAKVLKRLFDLWYKDYQKGTAPNIRIFDNICAMILGYGAETCELKGFCNLQNIITINGDIYPCNLYINPNSKIANIKKIDIKSTLKEKKGISFVKESLILNNECKKCKFVPLCKGGCKKLKVGTENKYYFCDTFKDFYKYSFDRFIKICREIQQKEKSK